MNRRRAVALLMLMLMTGALVGACGMWLHVQKQQYALNRALIAALLHDDTKQAIALVNTGADPNTRLAPSPAPSFKRMFNQLLHHSLRPANDSPTALILACGPCMEQKDRRFTYYNLTHEDVPLVQAMLARKADVNARWRGGLTALYAALSDNRFHTVEQLLLNGANVNAQDMSGGTPLMTGAVCSDANTIRLLLKWGADVNIQDHHGSTALQMAVWTSAHADVVRLLLDHGADPNVTDRDGQSASTIVLRSGRPDLIVLLRRGRK